VKNSDSDDPCEDCWWKNDSEYKRGVGEFERTTGEDDGRRVELGDLQEEIISDLKET
jgi:hypothetical protein